MMQMMGGGGGAFGAMPAAASACFGAAGAAPPMPAGGAPPPPGAAPSPFGAPAPPQPKAMKKKVARPAPRQPGFGGEEEAPAGPPPLSKWVGLTHGGLYVSDTAALPVTGTITSAAATPTTQRLSSRATLADALAALAPQLELAAGAPPAAAAPAGCAPLNLIDSVSSSHAFGAVPAGGGVEEAPLELKVLRLVECSRQMYPEAAGADAAWVTWAKEQKGGGAAAWGPLRMAG